MKLPIRFSLRTLAIGMTLLCLAVGIPIGYIRYQAERQRQTVTRLEELGVSVSFQKDTLPAWLVAASRRWIDPDAFRTPYGVQFGKAPPDLGEAVDLLTRLNDLRAIVADSATLTDQHFTKIGKIRSLTALMTGKGNCSEETARQLLHNHNWEYFVVPEVQLNDQALAEVAKMKGLINLAFDASCASAEGLETIKHCPNLAYFDLLKANHAGGAARAVRQLTKIKMLNLNNSTIGANDLAEFGEIGSLTRLHFYDCRLDSAKIDSLANAKGLTDLGFINTSVPPSVIDVASQLPKLSRLAIDQAVDDQSVGKLAQLSMLRQLYLGHTGLTDEGLQSLSKVRTLKILTLPEDTLCTEQGVRRLQKQAPIRVIIGNAGKGIHYLPDGSTDDRRNKAKSLAK